MSISLSNGRLKIVCKDVTYEGLVSNLDWAVDDGTRRDVVEFHGLEFFVKGAVEGELNWELEPDPEDQGCVTLRIQNPFPALQIEVQLTRDKFDKSVRATSTKPIDWRSVKFYDSMEKVRLLLKGGLQIPHHGPTSHTIVNDSRGCRTMELRGAPRYSDVSVEFAKKLSNGLPQFRFRQGPPAQYHSYNRRRVSFEAACQILPSPFYASVYESTVRVQTFVPLNSGEEPLFQLPVGVPN